MGKYFDRDEWVEDILIPDRTTPILGGEPVWEGDRLVDGYANVSPAQLANRTRHLKNKIDQIEVDIDGDFSSFIRKEDNLSDLEDIQQAKYNLELNLVDNTRDKDKEVSEPQQEALDKKVDKAGDEMTGPLVAKADAALNTWRIAVGQYGTFWRQDGNNLYLMTTAPGDALGSYTSARPFQVNLANGVASINGNAATANKLATARNIAITGDAAWNVNFDGSGNVSGSLTLSASGVAAGTYKSVTVDTKGRVTAGTNPTTLAGYGITDAAPLSHVGSGGNAHAAVTTTVNGFMAAVDKVKLDGIATQATKNATDAQLRDRTTHTGMQPISTITGLQDGLDSKVDKVVGKQLSTEDYTTTEKNKLAGVAVGATKNATDAQLRDRTTHTGVQPMSTITGLDSALNAKVDKEDGKQLSTEDYTTEEKGKLSGIATGATKNATDAQLRDRTTHTGAQAISTVTGLQTALDSKPANTTTITAGNGLEGGGNLTTSRTITLGTPSTITNSTTNSVTATSHTHALTITAADVGLGNVNNTNDLAKPVSTATQNALNNKVDKVSGYGLSQENYTAAEKSKLAGLESSKWRGQYTSVAALTAANPSATPGSYADVDGGVGQSISRYVWDSSDNVWVKQTGEADALTSSQVKQLYEANADTNAYTNAEKTKLSGIATNANNYVHPNSGVTAGTYKSVTVNAQGHVTAGTNPTTLAGYGINDAAPLSHVGSTGNAHGVATPSVAGFMSATDKQKLDGISDGAGVPSVTSVAGKQGAVTLVPADVGLGNVNNTSDANKPISTAMQNALNAKQNISTAGSVAASQFGKYVTASNPDGVDMDTEPGGSRGLYATQVPNTPTVALASFWWIETQATYSGSSRVQTAYAYASSGTPLNVIKVRISNNNGTAWSAWSDIWTSDTFNPETKFDKVGGTLTGDIKISKGSNQSGRIEILEDNDSQGFILDYEGATSNDFRIIAKQSGNETVGLSMDRGLSTSGLKYKGSVVYHAGNFDPSTKQNNLGYTPVQQGTGINQLPNVVKIGWMTGSRLGLTIDGTDFGSTWPISVSQNAATATKLATARTISLAGDVTGSANFDGSGNISITATVADDSHNHNASNITAGTLSDARLPSSMTGKTFTTPIQSLGYFDPNGSGPGGQQDGLYVGELLTTGTTGNPQYTSVLAWQVNINRSNALSIDDQGYLWGFRSHSSAGPHTFKSKVKEADTAATANSAATLTNARTINGTSFNGGANITTSLWGTARNITVGNTTKSVNGSANISWSLAEIGAGTSNLAIGTTSTTAKAGDWQPTNASKTTVLQGTSTTDFVTANTYANVISWHDNGSISTGTLTLNLDASLNHLVSIGGAITVGAPSNADPGNCGDILITMTGNGTVSWDTAWKFVGTLPDINASGEEWVVSYKVVNSTKIIASGAKIV